jgi:alcohol dehydrogenase (NADP+)
LDIVTNGCRLGGSAIGSKKEATEMLVSVSGMHALSISLTMSLIQQLAAEKNIQPWIQVFPMSKIKEGVEGMKEGKARYRYVLEQDFA